jgi:putative pyruvate formate lyase activating enzyme
MSDVPDHIERLRQRLRDCTLCPRSCHVDRFSGELGACRIGSEAVVASHAPHFGEESVLVGRGGSGTIFLAGCNLRCVYCQNCNISQSSRGKRCGPEELSQMALELQTRGCSNVNFVTPSHVAHAVAEAIWLARRQGLKIPTVYNSGGYDCVDVLKDLEGLIDIYLPDFKYASNESGRKYSGVDDYTDVARLATAEMFRQVGTLECDSHGVAVRGLIVRHLVLPAGVDNSQEAIRTIARQAPGAAVNVMGQYRPAWKAGDYQKLRRRPEHWRIRRLRSLAEELGLEVLRS